MYCPKIDDIPPPQIDKTGWPWTETSDPLSDYLPDGSPWPKISIVTPSYNQAQFLEETIRSVLLQGYPNLEYIIIDGGSTDDLVEIIKRYEPWLTYWVSEPDRGQSFAINKGFEKATGDIFGWINSDDYYAPNVLSHIATMFKRNQTSWISGVCDTITPDRQIRLGNEFEPPEFENWLIKCPLRQPSVFWQRELWQAVGGVDTRMQYSFDYELWMRFSEKQSRPTWTTRHLAYFRVHQSSKTFKSRENFYREDWVVFRRNIHRVDNIFKRLSLNFKRREKCANFYISISNRSIPVPKKIFIGLSYAPWWIFRKNFYYKIKNMIFPC